MIRQIIYTLLTTMLFGCTNLSNSAESLLLKQVIHSVNQELHSIGFTIDLSEITIRVTHPREMQTIFDHNTIHSRQELKTRTLFGPKARTSDSSFTTRLAFYDPNSKVIVIKKGASQQISKGYIAHELAHVYQDQKWGFENIWRSYHDDPTRELYNVTQFMIEGYAELVRQAYEQTHAKDPVSSKKLSTNLGKMLDNDCSICSSEESSADLPYSLGLRFLAHQYRNGGWPAVEKIFEDLPTSTEQIIHPQKYKTDEPTVLSLPKWDEDKNSELVLDGALGEAFLLSKLLSMSLSGEGALKSASGWDGDIAHLYRFSDNSHALVWRILFDRQTDAQQAEDAISSIHNPGEVFRVGKILDWIISDDVTVKKRLRLFLSEHSVPIEDNFYDEKSTLEQEISIKNDAQILYNPYFQPRVFIGPNL